MIRDTSVIPPDSKPNDRGSLHDWLISLRDDVTSRRSIWEGVWWENIATYTGDLWTEWNPYQKKLTTPVAKPDHRVRLPINLAQPAVRTELAKLTKNRPVPNVLAKSAEESDVNAADVGDKLLNNYAERQFHLPRVRRRMLQWVLMCGLGGIFVDWDETLGDHLDFYVDSEGNPVLDPRVIEQYDGMKKSDLKDLGIRRNTTPIGEVVVEEISPMAFGWDQSKNYIENAWWVIIDQVMDVEEVNRRWGVRPEADGNAVPGVIEQRMLSQFDFTNRLVVRPINAQNLCIVHRMYIRPGHSWFPDGAHIAFTDQQIVKQEPFPFRHGELPLSVMGHIPLPIGQYAMSILQQLRGPVLETSRTVSQLIENRNLMANPPWAIPRQLQIRGRTIQNKPGLRLEYTHIPNVPAPQPVRMPDMPAYVRELIPTFREFINLISGQGETSQGQVPAGARSGVAIAYLQEADDTRLGPTVQEYEETIERFSSQLLAVIAQYYTIKRTISLYRRNAEPEVFDFEGSMLAGNTQVVVQAGSALPRSKAAKQQFILDLWDRRIEQDPRKVRQYLELAEGEADEWEIDLQQAERENKRMLMGERPSILEWYNHPAHHYEHRRFMKTQDFENLPPEIQRIFMDHDAIHTLFEKRQQMEMAAQQAMMAGGPGAPPPDPNAMGGGESMNGTNNPEGPPAQFSGQTPPSSLMNQQPA